MGKKFVTLDQNNIVQEVFDEVNKNVPLVAQEITDSEFKALIDTDRTFEDFEFV